MCTYAYDYIYIYPAAVVQIHFHACLFKLELLHDDIDRL